MENKNIVGEVGPTGPSSGNCGYPSGPTGPAEPFPVINVVTDAYKAYFKNLGITGGVKYVVEYTVYHGWVRHSLKEAGTKEIALFSDSDTAHKFYASCDRNEVNKDPSVMVDGWFRDIFLMHSYFDGALGGESGCVCALENKGRHFCWDGGRDETPELRVERKKNWVNGLKVSLDRGTVHPDFINDAREIVMKEWNPTKEQIVAENERIGLKVQ